MNQVIKNFPEKYLESYGHELTRIGLANFISALVKIKSPICLDHCWSIVRSSLSHRDEAVQIAAVQAVKSVGEHDADFIAQFIPDILSTNSIYEKRGNSMAISAFPQSLIIQNSHQILSFLFEIVDPGLNTDAESRRNGVDSLSNLEFLFNDDMLNVFIKCLDDYSIDSRGDVGSWIRESAIKGITRMVQVEAINDLELVTRAILGVLQQSAEKIDRVRHVAGTSLLHIISSNHLAELPVVKHLKSVLVSDINWMNSAQVFSNIIPIFQFPECRFQLVKGLIVSVGGLTESLVLLLC